MFRHSREAEGKAELKTTVQLHLLTQAAVYMHCWLNWIFLSCIIKFQNPRVKTNHFQNLGLPIITMASHVALLWPVTSELLPTLVLVNAQCDPEARASVLVRIINHHYPSVRLTTVDCAFVYRKLEMFAPHLLGHSIPQIMLK